MFVCCFIVNALVGGMAHDPEMALAILGLAVLISDVGNHLRDITRDSLHGWGKSV